MMLSPQWESRSEFYVQSGKCQVHSTRKLLVHTLSCTLSATGTAQLVGSCRTYTSIGTVLASTGHKIHAPVSVPVQASWYRELLVGGSAQRAPCTVSR